MYDLKWSFYFQANTILPHSHSHHLHCLPTLMNMAASFDIPQEKRLWVAVFLSYLAGNTNSTVSKLHVYYFCHLMELCLVVFRRRASAAVNYLKRFHEKKKRGPKPYSLYLDHIIRKSLAAYYCRDQHLRPQRDIFVIKVCAGDWRKAFLGYFSLNVIWFFCCVR